MEFLEYGNAFAGGELLKRQLMSFDRLEESNYKAPQIFQDYPGAQSFDWPGDYEGRTLLALINLSRAAKRTSKTLGEILEQLPSHLNKHDFFGSLLDITAISEQQLSGNSWYIRALCELYEWKKEPDVLTMIKNCIESLMLPLKGSYKRYPIEKEARQVLGGREDGNLTGEIIGGWRVSTDIGCAFIPIDGFSHAYHLTKNEGLKELVFEMIERLAESDLISADFQTHATLSALRGILRFYEDTGESRLLELAVKTFDFYTKNGMTENFANRNWFCRPDWTEPCAVVDSYIVSMELWRHTQKSDYLQLAHSIFYNALYYAQRDNGGFGCDVCTGANGTQLLHPSNESVYEAWWCCTMRGGDGLAAASRHMAAQSGDILYLPVYQDGTIKSDGLILCETTGYPYDGNVMIQVLQNESKFTKLALFAADWMESPCMMLNSVNIPVVIENGFILLDRALEVGDIIELSFDLSPKAVPAKSADFSKKHTVRYGALQLCCIAEDKPRPLPNPKDIKKTGGGFTFTDKEKNEYFTPAMMTFGTREEFLHKKLQIIF